MKFLIAPDKFKGSLDASAVAENIAFGIHELFPTVEIELAPVADGGEGTAEIISGALDGRWVTCPAHDALGRAIEAHYGWIEDAKMAVMEMSEAAGLRRLRGDERDPAQATTFGVGEIMADAIARGARQIVIGLGGSATNDGGFGMARAFGFRFLREQRELANGVIELAQLARIIPPPKLTWPEIIAAADVRNPLLGENGATRVFAAQKGATPEQQSSLENALRKLADAVAQDLGRDFRDQPGAGAAGGLGFGLMSFCRARVRPGFDVVAEAIGLENKMRDCEIVITGEGRLDAQTLEGKAPAGVARLARKLGKPVYAIAGEVAADKAVRTLFDGVFELAPPRSSSAMAIAQAGRLLRERAAELARAVCQT
jgi:glycerate 2-kinase